jgi:hypothetical protein
MAFSEGVVYGTNVREVKNILGLLMIAFMLGEMTEENYRKFIPIYSQLVVVVLTFSAFIAVCNFFSVITGGTLRFFGITRGVAFIGISLGGSYNMFALGMFAGLFAALYCYSRSTSILTKIFYLIAICLTALVIGLAGSRRGWIVLILVLLYYIAKFSIQALKTLASFTVRIKVPSFRSLCGFFVIFFLGSAILISHKEETRIEKTRELRKIEYRFNTIFSSEGNFREAFAHRSERLDYAGVLIDGYDVWRLLVGSGFDYIDKYAWRFSSGSSEGNPHNIFTSAMFYSGIIGLVLMLLMIIVSGIRLYQNRDLFGEHFVLLFAVTLLFVTAGANSLFSVRLFPLILITILSVPKSRANHSESVVV